MIIPSIIRVLLDENSVAISGFGTFSVKKIPSQIKEDIVYPPKTIVVFEYSKDVEGYDFVSKLSKWEQVRIDEAQTEIIKWVNLIEEGLEHNKSLFFENFGTFSKDTSGNILFQSMLIPQLNIENEGFEPVCIPIKNNRFELHKKNEPVFDKRHVLVQKSKKRDKFWFLFTISATAVLLFALFFKETLILFYKNATSNNEIVAIIEEEETEIPVFIDHAEKKANKFEYKKETNVDSSPNNMYLPYIKGKYYVIAGSFTKDEDALLHIKQKKLEKYKAKIIVEPQNPRRRVCIGVFDNEVDAMNFAAQIDKNYWVLK